MKNKFKGLNQVIDPILFQRDVQAVVNNMLSGNLNNTGEMTVANGTTTTTVDDHRVTGDSVISLMAKDANSADISTFYVSSRDPANKQFTFTHNNSGNTRYYDYTITG